jgi:phage terminase large subunit GpA-like protein
MAQNESYLGNRNLKRSYVELEWTRDQVTEFVKCARDPVYFIENYVKIVNVDRGLIPFEPYDYQKNIINLSDKERFVICKMPRQVGKTTVVVGIIMHRVLFNENYSVAILAHKEKQAREILSRIQLAYEHMPRWLQQGIVEWNKGNVELENGSKIQASSTASSAIRGTSQNFVYLDEFAFVPANIQESFFNSVFPTISSGETTKVLITSTPNGLNLFYKLWADSEAGRNSYHRIDVHWSQVPGRDHAWKEEMIRNTSEEQFRQEFECLDGSTEVEIDHEGIIEKVAIKNIINKYNCIFIDPT